MHSFLWKLLEQWNFSNNSLGHSIIHLPEIRAGLTWQLNRELTIVKAVIPSPCQVFHLFTYVSLMNWGFLWIQRDFQMIINWRGYSPFPKFWNSWQFYRPCTIFSCSWGAGWLWFIPTIPLLLATLPSIGKQKPDLCVFRLQIFFTGPTTTTWWLWIWYLNIYLDLTRFTPWCCPFFHRYLRECVLNWEHCI